MINGKIRYLIGVKDVLKRLSKLVFQSGKNAKDYNYKIISSAKITSYPALHQVLMDADELVLDNPWKFASLCSDGIEKIDNLLATLYQERKDFTHGNKPKHKKGLI